MKPENRAGGQASARLLYRFTIENIETVDVDIPE